MIIWDNKHMKRPRPVQLRKIEQRWQKYTIHQKIKYYMITVFLCIALSVAFNVWVAKFSLGDFNNILSEGSKSSVFIQSIENETNLFKQYMKDRTNESEQLLNQAMKETEKAVYELPFQLKIIGEERYSLTWSIRNCYEVYMEKRNELFEIPQGTIPYIEKLYVVYDIQDYLRGYAVELMNQTLEAGSFAYQAKRAALVFIPATMAIVSILLILIMTELSMIMNRTIVNPISKLVISAKRIANNDFYIEDVPIENNDEVGELTLAFNKMKFATGEYIRALEENRKTLDLLHEEELQKLEVERRLETVKLEVLVNQVNPHFLFNTLNVIGGMAMLENAETTEKMIMALSSLFRYNLKNSSSETMLSQELKVIKDYMYIQKMRFGERLNFEIDCTAEESSTIIPTFTFQPLVENAIIHGLAPKEEGGKIRIRVWTKEGDTFITVHDTGVGMSKEQLEKLKSKLEEDSVSRDSIGVGNVYRRFKIMYPEGQFTIYSRENKGTLIKLQVPKAICENHNN